VSVIVPAYNAEARLGETLASLQAQTLRDVEILVVDDCSRDGTAGLVEACAAADPRVRYLRMPHNSGGPAGPRNMGVAQARSEWVAFCDADDLWHPDKLRLQFDEIRDGTLGLICTDIEPFVDGIRPRAVQSPIPAVLKRQSLSLLQMLLKNRVATSSVLCKRDLVRDLGGFNPERGMVAVEDYDLWLRMMTRASVQVMRIEYPLVAYRHLPGSLSSSKWRQAVKIARVHRSVFEFKGWRLLFPWAAPFLILCYLVSWLYLRSSIRRTA
jgi:teichuronic acid biosynthesis glycosyltransferase TuaG